MRETCGFHKAATWYEKKPEGMLEENNEYQESMNRSLSIHYILESTFPRIFLFLEPTLQQETHIYTNLDNLHTLFFAFFFSSFDNNFILIDHSKQCVQSRRTRGVLNIGQYTQSLNRRA